MLLLLKFSGINLFNLTFVHKIYKMYNKKKKIIYQIDYKKDCLSQF